MIAILIYYSKTDLTKYRVIDDKKSNFVELKNEKDEVAVAKDVSK
jgi:hypothetical protein